MDSEEVFSYTQGMKQPVAKRFNEGKARLDLVEPSFELALGKVLGFGAEKYGEFNWRNSCNTADHEAFVRGCIASLKRHTNKLQSGEFIDDESGVAHAAHIAANAMFIQYYGENYEPRKSVIDPANAGFTSRGGNGERTSRSVGTVS